MRLYTRLNIVFGWLCFTIAFAVYLSTMQPTVSFWDCGEFIASAFGMQVGHQPGAPLFIMLEKLFSLAAADPEQVAAWTNAGSALASAATILFLFWTITALALKIVKKDDPDKIQIATIMGAGMVGAMAFTFSDTFWFSAVETEVYALSSLCTALVFWAILKWEAHADERFTDRWLIFIAYVMGLSIGIHLLNLLAIPAIVLVYYFRKTPSPTITGIIKAILTGCILLGFVLYGVIQYLVFFAAKFDLFFVNSMGFGFGSGALFFILLIAAALTWGILHSIRSRKAKLNIALLCTTFILLGYSSYAMLVIRAGAKTAINISNPDNVNSLLGYLGREQYGDTPLLYGQYFDADYEKTVESSQLYRKGKDKYESAGRKVEAQYDRNTFFPRTYSDKPEHIAAYRRWLGISESEKMDFVKNVQFFTSYQLGFMYFRYFLWNFSGRQNDYQGYGDNSSGNWITGIKPLDGLRIGNQNSLPLSITENAGHNVFYALPLILGLMGVFYLYRRSRKDAAVISLLFFFTGIAIVLYLNQDPLQVRERDYAYVGSFYTFAICIGLGVLAVREFFSRISAPAISTALAIAVCFSVPFLMGSQGWDDHDRSSNYVPREAAINYLQSCAPNAILFTQGDNNTYPLWYAQQVEGVRKDIRLVNTELLYRDSYINQLKKQLFRSAPLHVTMDESKYAQGTRDILPYADYGIADSVELSDVFEVLTSDNKTDKIEMQNGSWSNFLPTKKFKMQVDADQVIKTGTLTNRSDIVSRMEWTYPKNYVSKADLAMLDIIAHNNWERPVYFCSIMSSDVYYGLDNYLQLEGFAFRLLPVKSEKNKLEVTNSDVMFNNLMNKMVYSSFTRAKYLDPESQNASRLTWEAFNTLALNLRQENKIDKSRGLMRKALRDLPSKIYTVADTVTKYRTAGNLYSLNDAETANAEVKSAVNFLKSELSYYASLDEKDQALANSDITQVLSILNAFKGLVESNNQPAIAKEINYLFDTAQEKLHFSLPG